MVAYNTRDSLFKTCNLEIHHVSILGKLASFFFYYCTEFSCMNLPNFMFSGEPKWLSQLNRF